MTALLLASLAGQSRAHESQQAQIEELTGALKTVIEKQNNMGTDLDKLENGVNIFLEDYFVRVQILEAIDHHIWFLNGSALQIRSPRTSCWPREEFERVYSNANKVAKQAKKTALDSSSFYFPDGDASGLALSTREASFEPYRIFLNVCKE